VDCGGPGTCPRCLIGGMCGATSDCAVGGECSGGVCELEICMNGAMDPGETDVDCGGTCAAGCDTDEMCVVSADCASLVCGTGGLCATPPCACIAAGCFDGVRNGDETDADCGGSCMANCADTLMCLSMADCISGVCTGGICRGATCMDGVRNGMETDVDCGGAGLMPCPRCAAGEMCMGTPDCEAAATCTGGMCVVPCPPALNPTDDGLGGAPQDLVISEINPGEYIEVYNNTGAAITLAGTSYQFCSPFSYTSLSAIGAGITVPSHGFALLGWPAGWSDTDAGGEVILYETGVFGDPGDVMDFVCWGVNPHGSRKATAELANKWTGACAPALTGGAIHRRVMTDGINAADYDTASAPSPSMCTP
jgi:hypothetical protein